MVAGHSALVGFGQQVAGMVVGPVADMQVGLADTACICHNTIGHIAEHISSDFRILDMHSYNHTCYFALNPYTFIFLSLVVSFLIIMFPQSKTFFL
jgi:hypothetical protein